MSTDPAEAALSARIRGLESWAQAKDPEARIAKARAGFLRKFETQVDPDGTLEPKERESRAKAAQQAHMARLSLVAARARRRAVADKDRDWLVEQALEMQATAAEILEILVVAPHSLAAAEA